MPPSLEESAALLEVGTKLLAVLSSRKCTKKCSSRRELARELSWLDRATKEFEKKELDGSFDDPHNLNLVEAEEALAIWTGEARTALQASLENCEGCPSLPAGAKELAAKKRQQVGSLLEGRKLINGAV